MQSWEAALVSPTSLLEFQTLSDSFFPLKIQRLCFFARTNSNQEQAPHKSPVLFHERVGSWAVPNAQILQGFQQESDA